MGERGRGRGGGGGSTHVGGQCLGWLVRWVLQPCMNMAVAVLCGDLAVAELWVAWQ